MNDQARRLLLEQGERAFMLGRRRDECPYLGSVERQVWGQGWDLAAERGRDRQGVALIELPWGIHRG